MNLIRTIDRGGFGIVDEIEDQDGQRVARKSFAPQQVDKQEISKLRKRFAREVLVQSRIIHPNIMPILNYDLDAATPWFTMPLASRSFVEKVQEDRTGGHVDPIAWQDILAGVEELHRLGYVHRDLKPANILLVEGTWVLSDFGLVLPTTRDTTVLTGSKSAYGTSAYAAPEQASDFRNTPPQADIFALGCILHDLVAPVPTRIPFAQIRIDGPYGPLLEKCTEVPLAKRVPNVSVLRALLFERWQSETSVAITVDEETMLEAVRAEPDSIDNWRVVIGHIENQSFKHALLNAINSELIQHLSRVDEILFSRLMSLMCEWAERSGFEFGYCDVVGDRLSVAYKVSPVRIKCEIALAALELAVSHNRWRVMRQVGSMLATNADTGLIDRMLIEAGLVPSIKKKLCRIEEAGQWSRDQWHPKLEELLNT